MWSAPLRSVMCRKPSSMYVARSDMPISSRGGHGVAECTLDHLGVIGELRILGVLGERVLHCIVRGRELALLVQCPSQQVVAVDVVSRLHLLARLREHSAHVAL